MAHVGKFPMLADAFPPSEESLRRLRRSGWSTGETSWRRADGTGIVQVDERNGENRILVRGGTASGRDLNPHYEWYHNMFISIELRREAIMDKPSNHAASLMGQTT